MANFLTDILACADGDVIKYIDFNGVISYHRFETVTDARDAGIDFTRTYRFEDAKRFLDYDYYDGYGSMDCHDITAWSDNYVYYIHEYDGSTCVMRLPKRPTKPNLPLSEESNSPEGVDKLSPSLYHACTGSRSRTSQLSGNIIPPIK